MKERILIIDDELNLLDVMEAYLKKEDFDVLTASNGIQGLQLFYKENVDFIILDLMLPDLSGERICSEIRKESDVPILMLTAKVEADHRIAGLEIGADDYVPKPFSPKEVVLRVKKILGRQSKVIEEKSFLYEDDHLLIDDIQRFIRVKEDLVELTPNEFDILITMAKHPGQVFSRDQIIDTALGYDYEGSSRTIDSHIKNLRKKIEKELAKPIYIQTVYGVGYKFGGVKP